jgi:RHS repeat-associated protein
VAWQERAYFFGKKLFVTEDNVGSALASSPSPRPFYPYGEPKSGTAATEQFAFATYWEDSETGLDYAMNRYYSSTLGRFLSPDPYKANNGGPGDPKDPQSWNRYAYVENDPVSRNDRSGTCWATVSVTGESDSDWYDCDGTGGSDPSNDGMVGTSGMNSGTGAMMVQAGAANPPTYAPAANLLSNNTLVIDAEFQAAFSAAWQVLQQPGCAGVFEPNADGSATDFAQEELTETDYRILPFPSDNTAGAQTLGNNVQFNLNGAFFTAQAVFGVVSVVFPSPYSPGVKDTIQMNQIAFQAMLILHELGHETGVFGPDTTDTVNGGYSDQVLENCFGISLQ